MWRAIVAIGGVCALAASDSAIADGWRLPDGSDNAMPRYYDYRAPRVYYRDEAPVAFRLEGYQQGPSAPYPPAVVYLPPAPPVPSYAPTGAYLPPPAYPPQPGGYAPPPIPALAVKPICGVYRFWNGERCVDARGD
jgi:hypothetical protein